MIFCARYVYSSRFKVNRCTTIFFWYYFNWSFLFFFFLNTNFFCISSSEGISIFVRVLGSPLSISAIYYSYVFLTRFNRPCNPCEFGPDSGGGPGSTPACFNKPPPAFFNLLILHHFFLS